MLMYISTLEQKKYNFAILDIVNAAYSLLCALSGTRDVTVSSAVTRCLPTSEFHY